MIAVNAVTVGAGGFSLGVGLVLSTLRLGVFSVRGVGLGPQALGLRLGLTVLSNETVRRLVETYDVYDLIEILSITASDIVDAFDYMILENEEILERIGTNQTG
jgi:hypothetical protein